MSPQARRILAMWRGPQGSPHFSRYRAIKESKVRQIFSEKNRKEPIKRARAGGVREKVEYRLDEEESSPVC